MTAFDVDPEREIALALRWTGMPSYERLAAFAEGIKRGLADRVARKQPLFIMLDGDVAQTLGHILRDEMHVESEMLVIDGVVLWISTTSISAASACRPTRAGHHQVAGIQRDPRGPRPRQRLHHHDDDHEHDHDHTHGHDHHHHDHDHSHHHRRSQGVNFPPCERGRGGIAR